VRRFREGDREVSVDLTVTAVARDLVIFGPTRQGNAF
jgi:hypothetical protein